MHGAMINRWSETVPGREAKVLEVFSGVIQRFTEWQQQGRISRHHVYFQLTGGAGGVAIIEGDLTELAKLMTEIETLHLFRQVAAVVSDFSPSLCSGGAPEAIQLVVSTHTAALETLGYLPS
jgi:hypothetical protein